MNTFWRSLPGGRLGHCGWGLLVTECDHDFPAVGVTDNGPLEQITHPARDCLEQLHLVRGIGADPEPSAGREPPGDVGSEIHLRPGLLLGAERNTPVPG